MTRRSRSGAGCARSQESGADPGAGDPAAWCHSSARSQFLFERIDRGRDGSEAGLEVSRAQVIRVVDVWTLRACPEAEQAELNVLCGKERRKPPNLSDLHDQSQI